MGRRKWLTGLALLAGMAVYAGNASWWVGSGDPRIIAHRGLAQTFDLEGVDGHTCTATRIHPPEHGYIENTLASMEAAFATGAEWVELDLHRAADGAVVVFHDAELSCRTDGTGRPEDHKLAELQDLDVGYGYTADGVTFPFRGRGHRMPSLSEVLAAFPGRAWVLDHKANDAALGVAVAAELEGLAPEVRGRTLITGGARATDAVRARFPELGLLDRRRAASCLGGYGLLGFTGYVPDACRGGAMMLPVNLAPWVWGFPARLERRLARHGSSVVLLGPWRGERFSRGVDEPALVPEGFGGIVWTNRVDRFGGAL